MISKAKTFSLLERSNVYISDNNTTLNTILASKRFVPHTQPYINIGMRQQTVWVEFALRNETDKPISKVLILRSPMLEHIALYEAERLDTPRLNGRYHNLDHHKSIFYHYAITLKPRTRQQYYLEVRSDHAPVSFSMSIEDHEHFLDEDRARQALAVMLISIIFALGLYNFLVSFYARDRSYFFYSMYLFALIVQQFTYVGLTQIYLSPALNSIDIGMANLKGSAIIVLSALFAMDFLKTASMPRVHALFIFFITVAILETIIVYGLGVQNMNALAFIAILYVTFTLTAGILSYRQGNKQARLFILGFLLLFTSYILFALDALGWTSLMQANRTLLVWGTAIDALILSLAFADRYAIVQRQKEHADLALLNESKNREATIQSEVVRKTVQLKRALESKETLLAEVHHRVKNNLQVILSIIRLQDDETRDVGMKEKLKNLESRISAIAKTYDMLILKDDLGKIDMDEYIEALLSDLSEGYRQATHRVKMRRKINATLPLKESVYVGLIINELVSNAYQHAFGSQTGTIGVSLTQEESHYTLVVEDNGCGYVHDPSMQTLGLKLIHALVYYQLEGTMESQTDGHAKYTIRFTI
jgi:two-component sensor histidine kinase